jgi:flagellar biosynthesis protein FlhG
MHIEDQAWRLRQMTRRGPRARAIAVASGKGGVGKSNIALNLSMLLSAAGRRVAMIDADLGLGNLDVLLGMEAGAGLRDVLAGTRSILEVAVRLDGGVRFVPAGAGGAAVELSEFQRAAIRKCMMPMEEECDTLVVDAPAGIGAAAIHFAASADIALVVTTPEPPAVTSAYALIKTLHRQAFAGRVCLLVNQAADRFEAQRTHRAIEDAARRFLDLQIASAGWMPEDARVRQAVRMRQPFALAFPDCPAAVSLAATAGQICREETIAAQENNLASRSALGA